MQDTDKRTDVWSRNFLIWEINFGLWAVAWAGLWEKGVWADSEQLFWVFFSMQLFSADAMVFSKKFVKKQASKVAHNRPRPFFPTVQPRPQPTAQN